MKLKVAHKGLIIVTIPLAIELVVIAILGFFVTVTDREYALESVRRNLSMAGAKLTFGNWHAGVDLIKAWKQRDQSEFDSYQRQFRELTNLTSHLEKLPQDDNKSSRDLHLQVVKMERQVLEYFDQIGDITNEGFTMDAFKKVIQIQKKMYKHVDETFFVMTRLFQSTDAQLRDGQKLLQQIEQLEIIVVEIGLALTVLAAILLRIYFNREFTVRIDKVRGNVDRLGARQKPEKEIDGDDEISELDRAFHDLWHQLAAAEERESALFDNSSDVILEIGEDHLITRANKAVSKVWGLAPEELLRADIVNTVHEDDQARLIAALQSTKSGAGTAILEVSVAKSHAELRQTSWSIFWAPQHRSWYCMVQDVSHLKELERTRQLFLQQITAGFQRPLHKLSNIFAEILADKTYELPALAKDRLAATPKSLTRLTDLVDGLLQIEELKNETPKLNRQECQVSQILEDAARDLEPQAQARKILLKKQCQTDTTFYVDSASLIRVLVNLLSNAIKFSPEGSTVTLSANLASDDRVVIRVQDEGRGIPEAALPELFQPFQQVKASDAKRGKGTGLGLFICKRLVEAHAGEISVTSQEGKGTEFRVAIPRTSSGDNLEPVVLKEERPLPAYIAEPAQALSFDSIKKQQTPSSFSFTLSQRGLWLIAVPVVLEIAFVVCMIGLLLQSEQALVTRTRERHIATSAISMTIGLFNFAVKVRHARSKDFNPDDVRAIQQDFPQRLNAFMNVAAEDPAVRKQAVEIFAACNDLQPTLAHVNNLLTSTTTDADWREYSNNVFYKSDQISKKVEGLLSIFDTRELTTPLNVRDYREQQIALLDAGLILNVWLTAGLALFFTRNISSRLRISAENTRRLPAGLPLLEPVSGNDEIAKLDHDFHEAARKLSAAREKEGAFFVNAQNILCALDSNLRFVMLSPSATRITGIATQELIGRHFFDLVSDGEKQSIINQLRNTYEQTIEVETHIDEGRSADLSWSISWSPIDKTYFAVGRDVTAQKALEKLKQEFIAVITHDLRTPLTTILGKTLLALENAFGTLPQEARTQLKKVRFEIDCMLELVNDLLDLEKMKSGKMPLHLEPVKLHDIFQDARKRFHDRLIGSDCDITIANSEALMHADRDRLSQCVTSLIIELQSLEPEEIELRASEHNGAVTVSITHSNKEGPGEADRVARVIERLCNVSEINSDKDQSPLRLPLAMRILEGHNGRLEVDCNEHLKLNLTFRKSDDVIGQSS